MQPGSGPRLTRHHFYTPQKVAATALWLGAKLEEVPEVSQHPEKLVRKVLVTVDRICSRREDPKPSLLEPTQKVRAPQGQRAGLHWPQLDPCQP
jgi:hypothetical protein